MLCVCVLSFLSVILLCVHVFYRNPPSSSSCWTSTDGSAPLNVPTPSQPQRPERPSQHCSSSEAPDFCYAFLLQRSLHLGSAFPLSFHPPISSADAPSSRYRSHPCKPSHPHHRETCQHHKRSRRCRPVRRCHYLGKTADHQPQSRSDTLCSHGVTRAPRPDGPTGCHAHGEGWEEGGGESGTWLQSHALSKPCPAQLKLCPTQHEDEGPGI